MNNSAIGWWRVTATCPVIKAHCAFIADHREVILGMLIEHLRPACT